MNKLIPRRLKLREQANRLFEGVFEGLKVGENLPHLLP